MDDVSVDEPANDLRDGVGFTNVGEEFVAQAFALGCALDDAGDVDERHGCGQQPFGTKDVCKHLQSGVGQVYDTDVGFNCGERVVRCKNVVARQRVEQGRLADIRESDDSNSKSHKWQVY